MGRTTARLVAALLGVIVGAPAFAHEPGEVAVTRARRLGWIEFRAWPGVDEPPARAVAGRMTPPRWAWSIPARVGDRSISFVGLTTWQPAKR